MASGGPNNAIRVVVRKGTGNSADILYDSGLRRSGVLSVPYSEPGTYSVCFDNTSAILLPRTVYSDIRLLDEGVDVARGEEARQQASDRQRRVGQILGKLVLTLGTMEKEWGTRQISPPIYIQISDDRTLNAFAIWQRKLISVNRGTLEFAESLSPREGDDVLAGVLAHELGHIFYRHSVADPSSQAAESLVAGGAGALMIHPLVGIIAGLLAWDRQWVFDRQQEMEADILGVQLSCAAGFNPKGHLTFHAKASEGDPSQSNFLRTHPAPVRRLEYLQREIENSGCS